MPVDDTTKEAATSAATLLTGGGLLAALGVFLKGLLSGATGQEKDTRDGLAQRNKVLEEQQDRNESLLARRADLNARLLYLVLQARLEAERRGFNPADWPDIPSEGGSP